MVRAIIVRAAVALGVAAGLASAADAQSGRERPRPEGRQIVVHARESWLTAGTSAPVGSMNSYVTSGFGGGPTTFTPFIDHTTAGVMGLERMPNNFTVPGCCAP